MPDEALKALDEQDRVWMAEAQMLARQAGEEGEVPIGAIIVRDGEIVGRGWNRNIGLNDPTAHAEIMAMRDTGRTQDVIVTAFVLIGRHAQLASFLVPLLAL